MFEQVSGDEFVVVSFDRSRNVARVTRSAERGDVAQITRAFDEANQALNRYDRPRLGLLIDLRAAPGRNDAEFERAMAARRRALALGFRAIAILVQTPVGELQIARIAREDGSNANIFCDEAKALVWLTTELR